MSYVKPNAFAGWSDAKRECWSLLENLVPYRQRSPDEDTSPSDDSGDDSNHPVIGINQSEWSRELGISRTAVQFALKVFEEIGLLKKVEHNEGRSRYNKYKVLWFFTKTATPKRKERTKEKRTYPKIVTKGSKTFKYIMMKCRRMVEDTHAREFSGLITGEIAKRIVGKHRDIGLEVMTKLRFWLDRKDGIRGFYVWIGKVLKGAVTTVRNAQETKRMTAEHEKIKEQKREQFSECKPPKLKDFGSFEDYTEALEEYEVRVKES